ncbi:MAG: flagellar basal-body MS-ring/collar protein FliF [Gemmatimonadota bacterium]|nr:flagellar basal-body MS-ring/collar protein FliF [Gemmatimonadota bacterium]
MNEFFQQFLTQAKDIWTKMPPNQRFAMIGVTVVTVVGMIALLIWAQTPKYDILYTRLEKDDADIIVMELDANKISYKLENSGTTILVSTKEIPETRLTLAGKGLPRGSGVGFEIFDQVNIGVTDYVQKINYRRALEGELTRSIETIRDVEKARVHIVIPEERLFSEDQKNPTASVIVKLRPSAALDEKQTLGISHLVSSSIEGMQPEDITIVDSYGNLISSIQATDPMVKLTAHQLELRQRLEAYLNRKVQGVLNGILGVGNSIVQVSTEIDFKKVEQTIRTYDPNNTVVRSEQTIENTVTNQKESLTTSDNTAITNFDINETMEHVAQQAGSLRRLTVAVSINHMKQMVADPQTGEMVPQPTPRPQQELDNIQNIVQNTVGYDPLRGDEIAINQFAFDTTQIDEQRKNLDDAQTREFWYNMAQKLLLVISILIFVLFARSLLRSLKILPPKEAAEEGIEAAVPIEEEISVEAQKRSQIQEQVMIFAKEKPANVAKLLKTWMVADAGEEE